MSTLLDKFKANFEKTTGMTMDEAKASLKTQNDVSARSGNNITMGDRTVPITGVGDKYGKVIKDAIKFYQDEFHVTPRANIYSDPDQFGPNILGAAKPVTDDRGQYDVNLVHLWDADAENGEAIAKSAEQDGHHPKGTGTLAQTPVHELGHVLSFQLFPSKKDIYKLYVDSLRDIGTDLTSRDETVKNTTKVSKYANADPYEAIAESLTDYYHNRDKSSPLARAVAKRMKNKGAMYGLTQSGGIGNPNETFTQNLRRYSAIQ